MLIRAQLLKAWLALYQNQYVVKVLNAAWLTLTMLRATGPRLICNIRVAPLKPVLSKLAHL